MMGPTHRMNLRAFGDECNFLTIVERGILGDLLAFLSQIILVL